MGLEGVISKKEDAIYTPGKRNFNWIKLKKVNESSVEDTLDCIVMGYYLGKGARQKFGIGGFLVGVLDNESGEVQSLSKVGTGLTDEEWVHLKHKIDNITTKDKPKNYVVDNNKGLALRFPRLIKIRDKKIDDSTSSFEVYRIYKDQHKIR